MKIYGNTCKQVVYHDWECGNGEKRLSIPMTMLELGCIGEVTTDQKIDEIVYNGKVYQSKYRLNINNGETYIYINADIVLKYEYEDEEGNKQEISKEEAYKIVEVIEP